MTEIARIVNMLAAAYNGNAWHGPSIRQVLDKIDPRHKDVRIGEGHSIIELVGHMAAWRRFAIEQLSGNRDFQVTDELNFPALKDWQAALQTLEQSQIRLIDILGRLTDEKLNEPVPTRKYPIHTLLHGIIQHDLYHLGQIVMIQKSIG